MKTIIYICLIITLSLLVYTCSNPPNPTPKGTYISEDNPFYKSITFKGSSTAEIRDGIFGFPTVVSYEKDGVYIKMGGDYSMLLFEIVSADTLRGEGFAKGTYVKQK